MQFVHEMGHVLAALITGGKIQRVVLHPLTVSRTDIAPNPRPLMVAWSGPILGAILPFAAWATWRNHKRSGRRLAFFAGFCLIANGAYIGLGSIEGVGDAGGMLRLGSPILLLWTFGLILSVMGFSLWGRVSGEFGFGDTPRDIAGIEIAIAWIVCPGTAVMALILANY